jgi:uncharacterized protein YndB with AHSA1/START domain
MSEFKPEADSAPQMETLVVRRTIRASPECLFAAWTEPDQLRAWWGPEGVVCIAAEIDLRRGGRYRIGNKLSDQRVLWIVGEFDEVEPPRRLVDTWKVDGISETEERVTVQSNRKEPRPKWSSLTNEFRVANCGISISRAGKAACLGSRITCSLSRVAQRPARGSSRPLTPGPSLARGEGGASRSP